jgi:predicted ATPase
MKVTPIALLLPIAPLLPVTEENYTKDNYEAYKGYKMIREFVHGPYPLA